MASGLTYGGNELSPALAGPPYRVVATEVFVSGAVQGDTFRSGATAGGTFVSGAVIGQVEGC